MTTDISTPESRWTATYHTLGCKLNFAETASLADTLRSQGCREAVGTEAVDVCVVNTCSVTETAEQKCRQLVRRLNRSHPGAGIVIMGCYAQLSPARLLALPGVRLVIGQQDKGRAAELILHLLRTPGPPSTMATEADRHHVAPETPTDAPPTAPKAAPRRGTLPFVPSCSRGDRTRYFLKVQDGCDYFCTYCTIPLARGASRSGSIEALVGQARDVAEAGGREIVLTGVNIGDFGRGTDSTLLDLLRALDAVEGIMRYRISSIEPNLLTDEIIDFCASSRAFMPHFHLPLQSGADDVLRLMRRRYDTHLFRQKVERIRQTLPEAFIGVDVIVGTRGETDTLHREGRDFIDSLDISQLHVFNYSERPGTAALRIPHRVSPDERHARSRELLALSEKKRLAFYERFAGTCRPVLWEHAAQGQPLRGFTDNYVRVEAPANAPTAWTDTVQPARLGQLTADGSALRAEPPAATCTHASTLI